MYLQLKVIDMKIDFALVWLCLFRCLIIEVEGASISSYKPMYSKFFRPQRSWSVVDPIVSLFKAIFGSQKDRVEYVHIKPVKRKRVTKVDKLQMVRICTEENVNLFQCSLFVVVLFILDSYN